jgi:alkanesulfonate monooxygenase SsuD/methylene tetrahydromethanopterin reductase-like flavin-dependent oxidoreductase (luciferase family)
VSSARHPVALADEAVLLDAVSGGRFTVARGGPWVDLEVFGTGLSRSRTGFPESLDVLTGRLSGTDTFGAFGEHLSFRPVSVVPQPERAIPVYVAARTTTRTCRGCWPRSPWVPSRTWSSGWRNPLRRQGSGARC